MRILTFLMVLVGGAVSPSAFAVELPDWAQNQAHYAQTLNPIAAQVMQWTDQQQTSKSQVIKFDNADLVKTGPDQFRFELVADYLQSKQQLLKTTHFYFTTHENLIPTLTSIQSEVIKSNTVDQASSVNHKTQQLHYRAREIAYLWLAHLDGITDAHTQVSLAKWIENASFTRAKTDQQFHAIDAPSLSNGGHLLRTIKIEPTGQNNQYTLKLNIDWQGKLTNGKTGIASMEHIMFAHLNNDGAIIVERIIEHSRLPSLAPWTKILC